MLIKPLLQQLHELRLRGMVSVLPHVILLLVASSAMLPGGLFPSPSDLIVSGKAEGQSDAGGGRSPD
jgi:hypothetical protein